MPLPCRSASALVTSAAILAAGCGDEPGLRDRLLGLGAAPCPEAADFLCFPLTVPLDHARRDGPTIDVRFAVRPARGPHPRGVLLTILGGPGYSGVHHAKDYAGVDPRLGEDFDLAFFDLRGLGGPRRFDCPEAADALHRGGLRGGTPAEDAVVGARAADFSATCFAEAGARMETAPFYTTAQAVEDVEAFRARIGAPRLTLYGLSYGTQLAQAYATAHPDRVRAIALDGVVDPSIADRDFAADLTRRTNDVLARTLAACAADPACAADVGGDPAAYDALAAAVAAQPRTVTFPLPSGATATRTIGPSELDDAATTAVATEEGRAAFLRALAAAASRDDLVPLLRVRYWAATIDPTTARLVIDPTYSEAEYYLVTCNDYGHPPGATAAERQAPWLAAGDALREDGSLRVFQPFYGDLPCATWPSAPPAPPLPAPFVPPAPVLLIDSDADTATPVDQGAALFARLRAAGANARAITVSGGHHVMLAKGAPCVDRAAARFFLDPEAGSGEETSCPVPLSTPYVPLTPASVAALGDPLAMVSALEAEIRALPGFRDDGKAGCDRGGRATMDRKGQLALAACSFAAALSFDGTGSLDAEGDHATLAVQVHGAHEGQLAYTRDGEKRHVSGTLDGLPVDETQ